MDLPQHHQDEPHRWPAEDSLPQDRPSTFDRPREEKHHRLAEAEVGHFPEVTRASQGPCLGFVLIELCQVTRFGDESAEATLPSEAGLPILGLHLPSTEYLHLRQE